MPKESRQVRRAKLRAQKKKGIQATHEVYYIERKRKSRAGVEYTFYQKIIDIIGRRT